MICLGKKFSTPRKQDESAWKKLEWLIQNGWRGYGWPVSPEMSLLELQQSLADKELRTEETAQSRKQDQAFEEKHGAARKRQKAQLKRRESIKPPF